MKLTAETNHLERARKLLKEFAVLKLDPADPLGSAPVDADVLQMENPRQFEFIFEVGKGQYPWLNSYMQEFRKFLGTKGWSVFSEGWDPGARKGEMQAYMKYDIE